MKFTLSWLKKFLDTNATLFEITETLTQIGFEVEEVIDRKNELSVFQVAEIIKTSQHPSADKLKICEVKTQNSICQIICGASNARAGIKVVLAPIGAEIPNGKFKIKESEIRGIKSFGMLCSESELLIGSNNEGIIELPEEALIGDSIIKYYGLDDPVLHIEVTPNRPDALGVYGIARELAAKEIGKLKEIEKEEILPQFTTNYELIIKDKLACPFFGMRELRDLKNCESPDWLKKLLENIGIGSISAIVDVTNYISYSFGQPMHAYDADKIIKGLEINFLTSPTKFKALNGKEYELNDKDLVIKDHDSIQCLAGIIGGESSACTSTTSRIILEAAYFDPITITKSGRHHQIITDSRYRFERGTDKSFITLALNIATRMILSICGGNASQIISQGNREISPRTIEFAVNDFTKITGLTIAPTIIRNILEKLGFNIEYIKSNEELLKLTIPSWRNDIAIKEDIVEEVIRIYGYDKLPISPLPNSNITTIVSIEQRRIFESKRILSAIGFDEIVSWSFMDSNSAKLFNTLNTDLSLINPISSDLNYMRSSIIPNLLKVCGKNLARSFKDMALFEVGPVFLGTKLEDELTVISGIKSGQETKKNCHSAVRQYDIFDIKADLSILLDYFGFSLEKCQIKNSHLPYYHPTRSATLHLGKTLIATFGQIHPNILKHYEIDQSVYAFEFNLFNLPLSKPKFGRRDQYEISDFPIVTRDYAFLVNVEQPVGEIISYIKNIDKKLIQSVSLFDIYQGDKSAGKKSIGLSIRIQANDRTLSENDLNNLNNKIILEIEQNFSAKLRDY